MSANVLLNLLNELGKRDKMRGLPSILSLFRNELIIFLCDLILYVHSTIFQLCGTGLPGLNQYKARINVSCSRTTTQ